MTLTRAFNEESPYPEPLKTGRKTSRIFWATAIAAAVLVTIGIVGIVSVGRGPKEGPPVDGRSSKVIVVPDMAEFVSYEDAGKLLSNDGTSRKTDADPPAKRIVVIEGEDAYETLRDRLSRSYSCESSTATNCKISGGYRITLSDNSNGATLELTDIFTSHQRSQQNRVNHERSLRIAHPLQYEGLDELLKSIDYRSAGLVLSEVRKEENPLSYEVSYAGGKSSFESLKAILLRQSAKSCASGEHDVAQGGSFERCQLGAFQVIASYDKLDDSATLTLEYREKWAGVVNFAKALDLESRGVVMETSYRDDPNEGSTNFNTYLRGPGAFESLREIILREWEFGAGQRVDYCVTAEDVLSCGPFPAQVELRKVGESGNDEEVQLRIVDDGVGRLTMAYGLTEEK